MEVDKTFSFLYLFVCLSHTHFTQFRYRPENLLQPFVRPFNSNLYFLYFSEIVCRKALQSDCVLLSNKSKFVRTVSKTIISKFHDKE